MQRSSHFYPTFTCLCRTLYLRSFCVCFSNLFPLRFLTKTLPTVHMSGQFSFHTEWVIVMPPEALLFGKIFHKFALKPLMCEVIGFLFLLNPYTRSICLQTKLGFFFLPHYLVAKNHSWGHRMSCGFNTVTAEWKAWTLCSYKLACTLWEPTSWNVILQPWSHVLSLLGHNNMPGLFYNKQ